MSNSTITLQDLNTWTESIRKRPPFKKLTDKEVTMHKLIGDHDWIIDNVKVCTICGQDEKKKEVVKIKTRSVTEEKAIRKLIEEVSSLREDVRYLTAIINTRPPVTAPNIKPLVTWGTSSAGAEIIAYPLNKRSGKESIK